MKVLQQFLIICAIAFVGDLLNGFIPLPVPGGVWGMVLLLLLLMAGIVKLPQIEKAADFLTSIMAVMFVPYVADFILMYDVISKKVIELAVIILGSTAVTMVVTGAVVQKMRKGKKDAGPAGEETNG